MSKIKMTLSVKGKSGKEYSFDVYADKKYLDQWWNEGIEIYPLVNEIPEWAVNMGLTHVYCFFQDIFNFKNPFKK
jgi:hypothetical protein